MSIDIDTFLDDVLDPSAPTIVDMWQPAPENKPQQMAYDIARSGDVMQMGYGGMAGGGKTDLILGLAGSAFKSSVIIRRQFTQLTGIIERGNKIYPQTFVSGEKKYWVFDDKVIRLRHAGHDSDWESYQGQSFPFIGIDEAAQFSETLARSILGWNRDPDGGNTLTLMCFNPPTSAEGEWIVKMFAPWVDPSYSGHRAVDGEIRWFAHVDDKEVEVESGEPFQKEDGEIAWPISRTFIAASRYDNPYLGEDYERQLDNLPEPLRSIIRDGSFTVSAKDDIWQVIPTQWILAAQERWRNGKRPDTGLVSMGIDPSRGGDDFVISKLYGNWFDELVIHTGSGAEIDGDVGAELVLHAKGDELAPLYIDSIGIGSSVMDSLNRNPGANVIGINNSAAPPPGMTDTSGLYEFVNMRAASYWLLRKALNPTSGEDIALPDDRDLRVELQAARYKRVGAKIQIEPKDAIKKRLGRSPDRADAVVLAWWHHSVPPFQMDWI